MLHGYFTTQEAAKICRVKEATILRWIRDGVFADVQIDEGGFSGRPSFCIKQSEVERLNYYITMNRIGRLTKRDVRWFKAQPIIDEFQELSERCMELYKQIQEILEIES